MHATAHLAGRCEVSEARAIEVDRVGAHRGDGLARPPLRAWDGHGVAGRAPRVAGRAPRVAGSGYMGLQACGAVRRGAVRCGAVWSAPIIEKSGTPLTRHSAVGEARQWALAM